jgi:hypothetical protein
VRIYQSAAGRDVDPRIVEGASVKMDAGRKAIWLDRRVVEVEKIGRSFVAGCCGQVHRALDCISA